MRALYETVIALTVKFEDIPRVAPRARIELTKLAEGFWHITVHFGFVLRFFAAGVSVKPSDECSPLRHPLCRAWFESRLCRQGSSSYAFLARLFQNSPIRRKRADVGPCLTHGHRLFIGKTNNLGTPDF
jgi:hypothetical protein